MCYIVGNPSWVCIHMMCVYMCVEQKLCRVYVIVCADTFLLLHVGACVRVCVKGRHERQ